MASVITRAYGIQLGKLVDGTTGGAGEFMLDGGKARIGCKGWALVGGVKTPKTPDPLLIDIEATSPADGAGDEYYWEVAITAAMVNDNGDGSVTVTVDLALGDGNGQAGAATASTFYEIGIYDALGTLMVYGTFAARYKDPTIPLQFVVNVTMWGN